MNASDFVHLHVHSDFSLLDGAAKVSAIAKAAKVNGQIAVALTDHGTVSGAVKFHEACEKEGIKPLIGCEAYLAPGDDELAHTRRQETEEHKKEGTGRDYNHFTLIAKNDVGWKNLTKLASIAALEGFYYRPRMSWHLIQKYHEGLIALSGCLKGQTSTWINRGQFEKAEFYAKRWKEVFGGDFYMEVMPSSVDGQASANDGNLELARKWDIKPIATADLHYIEPEEAEAQEVKICVNSHKTLADNDRLRMSPEFYFRSSENMQKAFSHVPEAILATREVADKVTGVKIKPGKFFLPKFQTPIGLSTPAYFRKLCREGLVRRYGTPNAEQVKRLEYEMAAIEKMGFVDYFLITQDFCDWARKNGSPPGPGRGSAAGAITAYCLGITNIDPLRYDLIFERFLNPERVSMPDIDIDFSERTRDKVIDYVTKKYGDKNVCQIVTWGEFKAKSAIRDVARVIDAPPQVADRLAKLIPVGPKVDLEMAIEAMPELKVASEAPDTKRLFSLALSLEGLYKHAGRHAAGVVISDTDLSERIPLMTVGKEKIVCTQFAMEEVEAVGLLKMDFLGLRTLTVIEDALDLIHETTGKRIMEDDIPVRDNHSMLTTTGSHMCPIHRTSFSACRCCDKTLELLCRGEGTGVFQVESSGMRKLLIDMKPDRFDDIIALVALYRPGPLGSGMDQTYVNRKHGREEIVYDHPILEPILGKSFALMIFQEQMMQLSVALAGFTLPEADTLRKATGKKKPEVMAKMAERFVSGCQKTSGLDLVKATEIWNMIVKFADYSFNCVTGDSEVVDTETGKIARVDSLVGRKTFRVHALGEDLKIRSRHVTRAWEVGEKEVFEVRTKSDRRLKATAEHPFRTFTGWTKLSDLRPGDMLAMARSMPVKGSATMPRHEIITLAGLLSEGNTCHPTTLYFTNKDSPEYLDEFAREIAKFDDTVVRLETPRNKGATNVVANMGPNARQRHGERCGAFLWADRLGLIGKKATKKVIPDIVFRLNEDDLKVFMGRMWSGDGYVGYTDRPGRAGPFYASSSLVMARQVQFLLTRLGITNTLHHKQFKYRGSHKPGWTVNLLGLDAMLKFKQKLLPEIIGYELQKKHFLDLVDTFKESISHDKVPRDVREIVDTVRLGLGLTWTELEIRTGVSVRELQSNLVKKGGFTYPVVRAVANYTSDQSLKSVVESDVFWDPILSITRVGVEKVYDLEVEKDHNFVVNGGFVVHNCSHSAAYGMIAYHTAWLKANYPVEFMAATLSSWCGDTDKLGEYIDEIRRMGIPLEPPDVNLSQAKFSVATNNLGLQYIIYGLEAVKGVGPEVVARILEARNRIGRFQSIVQFCEEVPEANRGVLETFAKAGAFRSTGAFRSQLLHVTERTVSTGKKSSLVRETTVETAVRMAKTPRKDKAAGQGGLFQPTAVDELLFSQQLLPQVPEWGLHGILEAEKESIGFYLTGHPLDEYRDTIMEYSTIVAARSLELMRAGVTAVTVGCIIRGARATVDKSGKEMAFLVLEDFSGTIDGVCFSGAWRDYKHLVVPNKIVFVAGELDASRDRPSIRVQRLIPLEGVAGKLPGSAAVKILYYHTATAAEKAKVHDLLRANPGKHPVHEQQAVADGITEKRSELKVNGSRALRQEIQVVLGGHGKVKADKF
jgi:DNA polymerase-3 subunit alpha